MPRRDKNLLFQQSRQDGGAAFALLATDIRVGDEADGVLTYCTAENAFALEGCGEARCITAILQSEENDVGLNGWEIDFGAFAGCNGFR